MDIVFNKQLNYLMAQQLGSLYEQFQDSINFTSINCEPFEYLTNEDIGCKLYLPKTYDPEQNVGLCVYFLISRFALLIFAQPCKGYNNLSPNKRYPIKDVVDSFSYRFRICLNEELGELKIDEATYMRPDTSLLFEENGARTNYVFSDGGAGCIYDQKKLEWIENRLWNGLEIDMRKLNFELRTMDELRSDVSDIFANN